MPKPHNARPRQRTTLTMFAYRLLIWIVFPIVLTQTAIHAFRHRCLRCLQQRLGFINSYVVPVNDGAPLWFHCASIGETNAALPLIQHWLATHTNDSIVITTNTATAAKRLQLNSNTRLRHYFLPLDYPRLCRRFLHRIKPRCALILETEIWLNMFTACEQKNIPIIILNGRISKKTLNTNRLARRYYQTALSKVSYICTRSEADVQHYQQLGMAADRISCCGNLKYTAQFSESLPNLIGREYFLAASTHADEEQIIARICADTIPEKLLVLVPRHPERSKAIAKQLQQQGCRVQLRSRQCTPASSTTVYIADTIGELPALIRHAALVFTGGSLAVKGGQNILEAAMLQTPQITGPHTYNFREEMTALKSAGGILEVSDEVALAGALRDFVNDEQAYKNMTARAYAYVQTQSGIIDKYAAVLEKAYAGQAILSEAQ